MGSGYAADFLTEPRLAGIIQVNADRCGFAGQQDGEMDDSSSKRLIAYLSPLTDTTCQGRRARP
jgi:hypothetical protein